MEQIKVPLALVICSYVLPQKTIDELGLPALKTLV